MLRRLLIAIFILANLTSQVSVAYACGMMGGNVVVLKHCCCHEGKMEGSNESMGNPMDCCDKVVQFADEPGDHGASLAALSKLPSFDPQLVPLLLPVLLAIALPSQTADVAWPDDSAPPVYGSDLYLRTQRLRL